MDPYKKGIDFWSRDKKKVQSDFLCRPHVFDMLGDVNGKRILDVGCGEGYMCRILSNKGAMVTGVDVSKDMILEAKRKGEGPIYFINKAQSLKNIESKSKDIAISVLVFNSFKTDKDWGDALKEIKRVLVGNGRFILAVAHPFERIIPLKTNFVKYLKYVQDYWGNSPIPKYLFDINKNSFLVNNYNRNFEFILNTLIKNGFTIKKIKEPKLDPKDKKTIRLFGEEDKKPSYLLIESIVN
jgi:ubiquinone/menaquinone biosynthesis C-methylase UbiE